MSTHRHTARLQRGAVPATDRTRAAGGPPAGELDRPPSGRRRPRPGRPLVRKYTTVLVALVGGALLVSSLVQVYFSYRETRTNVGRIEHDQAVLAATQIRQFLAEIVRQLESTASPAWLAADLSLDQRRTDLLRTLRQAPAIVELRYLNDSGHAAVAVSRQAGAILGSDTDVSQDATWERAGPGQPAFSPLHFRNGSEPYVTLAVAPGGTDAGGLLAEINLTLMWDVVRQIAVGGHGVAYVVDEEGRLLAHPDLSLVLKQADAARLAQVQAARASAGRDTPSRTLLARNLQGDRVLAAYAPVTAPGWSVIAEEPLRDAFAPLIQSLLRIALFLLLGLLLAVGASLLLVRRMVRPIRALQTGAARIGAGDLDQRITVRTGDELEALAEDFNRMSAQLQASYATLEEKVVDRTRELAAALAQLEVQRAQLEAQQAELAAASGAKSEFLSRMSHELRTPLNAIIGFAEIMELDPATTPKQRERTRHILRGGRHLLGLINEVLDITRIEAGRLALSPEPVPLARVVQEVLDLVQPLAGEHQVTLVVEEAIDPQVTVLADRQRLRQVVLNLVTNAVKYNHAGGQVCLRATAPTDGPVRLSVQDTGPGIAPEALPRLFAPFERLGADQTTIEGSGLGLAISQRLLEAMGGAIGVASVVGEGSTFWIDIPQAAPLALTPAIPEELALGDPLAAPSHSAATVLYIEDNAPNVALVQHLLGFRPGITLLTAPSGEVGLRLAARHQPSLILLDLNLPDLHGDAVLTRLRAQPGTAAIPVAVISADATERQIARLLAAGACAYLTKPLEVRQFLELVDTQLARRSA